MMPLHDAAPDRLFRLLRQARNAPAFPPEPVTAGTLAGRVPGLAFSTGARCA